MPVAGDVQDLIGSFLSSTPVSGHTHNFYRYPARFSPQFARAAIEEFTEPGDTVLDPFLGGGTTAVETLAAGRRFVGCDINPLATFLARTKTTGLGLSDAEPLIRWSESLHHSVNLRTSNNRHADWMGYQRNLPWWLRKALELALDSLRSLRTDRQRRFARCTLLRTSQWALDCRRNLPSTADFLNTHARDVRQMVQAALSFSREASRALGCFPSGVSRHSCILTRSAAGLESDGRVKKAWLPPRLVLTSPPYAGVHILYHRWQVLGRRETAAPYWLAACRDGHGGSYYTFGDRKRKDIGHYLDSLYDSFASVAALTDKGSVVVQLVAFSDPRSQIPAYLGVMDSLGFYEHRVAGLPTSRKRLWRTIPNRKWYADYGGKTSASQELLLIHKKLA